MTGFDSSFVSPTCRFFDFRCSRPMGACRGTFGLRRSSAAFVFEQYSQKETKAAEERRSPNRAKTLQGEVLEGKIGNNANFSTLVPDQRAAVKRPNKLPI